MLAVPAVLFFLAVTFNIAALQKARTLCNQGSESRVWGRKSHLRSIALFMRLEVLTSEPWASRIRRDEWHGVMTASVRNRLEHEPRVIALRGSGGSMDKDQSLLTRFGQLVRSVREERGFTQKELADRAGMTDKHVGEIERGVAEASITAIIALADGLRVRLSVIMPDQLRAKHTRTHRHTQPSTLN